MVRLVLLATHHRPLTWARGWHIQTLQTLHGQFVPTHLCMNQRKEQIIYNPKILKCRWIGNTQLHKGLGMKHFDWNNIICDTYITKDWSLLPTYSVHNLWVGTFPRIELCCAVLLVLFWWLHGNYMYIHALWKVKPT